jgi:16S rRNA (uracil1498-N3)-methyltransferase
MTRRRFFAPPDAFDRRLESITLSTDEAKHLREVLRLKVGDKANVFDGEGREFLCHVMESRRETARLAIEGEISPASPESPLNLTLGIALLKGEKFDLVVQKTTELGIKRIVPIISKLADVRLREDTDAAKRVTRWQRIALEAAKQSGRAVVPVIETPEQFLNFVRRGESTRLMFSERDGQPLGSALHNISRDEPLMFLVGSEGGWTNEELEHAQEAHWSIVTLGGRILRAETAAMTITALLQHRLGDLV